MADNMDIKDLFNLNQNELQQLAGILSKKNTKMSKKEQNILLSKLSNMETTKTEVKNTTNMSVQEKLDHRNELKQKIRLKQNKMRNDRKPRNDIKNGNVNMEEKLAETINKLSEMIPNKIENTNIEKDNDLEDYMVS